MTSYLLLSKYFLTSKRAPAVFLVYYAFFFLAYITAYQLPFWLQALFFVYSLPSTIYLSFHYHPNDMIVRRNPLLQKWADHTKYFSLTPLRRQHIKWERCQYLQWLSSPSSLSCNFNIACCPKKLLENDSTLAFVYSLNTNFCFCICIYWCLKVPFSLHFTKKLCPKVPIID